MTQANAPALQVASSSQALFPVFLLDDELKSQTLLVC